MNDVQAETKEIAEHSSVGLLVTKVDKAIKRNLAMPVGEFWAFHLKPILEEMHRFHIDYAEDAASEAAEEGGGGDVDALVDLAVDAKELVMLLTSLLMGSYAKQGLLDKDGQPLADKMTPEEKELFVAAQTKLAEWTALYPTLIDEQPVAAPDGSGAVSVVEGK